MSSVRYQPISKLLKKFGDMEEELYEELRNGDISWGAEKQITLGEAEYIHDVIDERLNQELGNAQEAQDHEAIKKFEKLLEVLEKARGGLDSYYCMEE